MSLICLGIVCAGYNQPLLKEQQHKQSGGRQGNDRIIMYSDGKDTVESRIQGLRIARDTAKDRIAAKECDTQESKRPRAQIPHFSNGAP